VRALRFAPAQMRFARAQMRFAREQIEFAREQIRFAREQMSCEFLNHPAVVERVRRGFWCWRGVLGLRLGVDDSLPGIRWVALSESFVRSEACLERSVPS